MGAYTILLSVRFYTNQLTGLRSPPHKCSNNKLRSYMDKQPSKGIRFIALQGNGEEDLISSLEKLYYPLNIISLDVWQNLKSASSHCVDLLHLPSVCQHAGLLQQISGMRRQEPMLYIADHNRPCAFDNLLTYYNDFIYWPCSHQELHQRVSRLMALKPCTKSPSLQQTDYKQFMELQLLGQSPAFLQALYLVRQSAKYESPVLIEGETGTGKELVARAIHYLGQRRSMPFIPINCGAIPDSLFENELYGHKRGAYTDASQDQVGLVELTDQGTLFLDEIESLSSKGQVVLLRFLQDMVYKPLGSKVHKKADIRVIAATNQPLADMVDRAEFRKDLFFRLNILSLWIPPLRERHEDIELLALHFLEKYRKEYGQVDKHFHRNALQWMWRYSWPGNVREMENIIHRGFMLAEGNLINFDDMLIHRTHERRKNFIDRRALVDLNDNLTQTKRRVITHFESVYLQNLMRKTEGNISRAAKIAGKERRALGKLLKKYEIDRRDYARD